MLLPLWVSHFATVRHDWECRTLFRVCSPACGGAVRRSRTEGVACSSPCFRCFFFWEPPPSRSNSCGPPPPAIAGRGHVEWKSVAQKPRQNTFGGSTSDPKDQGGGGLFGFACWLAPLPPPPLASAQEPVELDRSTEFSEVRRRICPNRFPQGGTDAPLPRCGRSGFLPRGSYSSRNPSRRFDRAGWRSFARALVSNCRIRSRVTSKWPPTSSSVRGAPSSSP